MAKRKPASAANNSAEENEPTDLPLSEEARAELAEGPQVETEDWEIEPARPGLVHSELAERRRKKDATRRAEMLSLLMAGMSHEQIATRMEMSVSGVHATLTRALRDRPMSGVDELRAVENARLDRAQTAVWSQVLEGDHKAIGTFLRISQRRAKLNGLDAPMKIDLSADVRMEMQQALDELQDVVMGEVIEADRYDSDRD